MIVCKPDVQNKILRGYTTMLPVKQGFSRAGIGWKLVAKAIEAMKDSKVEEIVFETEMTNTAALRLMKVLASLETKDCKATT